MTTAGVSGAKLTKAHLVRCRFELLDKGSRLHWGRCVCKSSLNIHIPFISVFSSPEPKAHRWACSIGRHPSSVRPSSVVVNIFKRHLLWSHEANSRHISHIASIGRGNEYRCFFFFFPNRIRTMVAMAAYSFHWLITGKSGNWQFLLPHCIYLVFFFFFFFFFLQKCFLSCPLRFIWILSKSLNLIGCHGNRNRKGDEA